MGLTLETARELAEVVEDMTGIEVNVREDYSGRGMYGRTVVAFTASEDPALALAYAAAELGVPFEDLPTRRDSMGRGVVIY